MSDTEWHYEIGQRVKREYEYHLDIPKYRIGTIINRYSKPKKVFYGRDLVLGPYPELYSVQWDDGKIENGFFWYGVQPV